MNNGISSAFITPGELRKIADMCEAYSKFMNKCSDTVVASVLMEDMNPTFRVIDSNGDILGTIGSGDGSVVFYLNERYDDE